MNAAAFHSSHLTLLRANVTNTNGPRFFRDFARRKWRGNRRSLSSSSSSRCKTNDDRRTTIDERRRHTRWCRWEPLGFIFVFRRWCSVCGGRARLPEPIRQPARSAGRRTGGPGDCRSEASKRHDHSDNQLSLLPFQGSEAPPAERVASGSPPKGGVHVGKAPLGLCVSVYSKSNSS